MVDEVEPERLDERRLPRAGRAADADPHRATGRGKQLVEQRDRLLAVIGARRLDERDRARARLRRSPARIASDELAHAMRAGLQQVDDLGRGHGDVGARPEDRAHTRLAQRLVVVRGDHAADHDEDLATTLPRAARR